MMKMRSRSTMEATRVVRTSQRRQDLLYQDHRGAIQEGLLVHLSTLFCVALAGRMAARKDGEMERKADDRVLRIYMFFV
jgi:hypothetical protein